VLHLIFSHLLLTSFPLLLTHANAAECIHTHISYHMHTFLVHFHCWACFLWHSLYILIQNVLNSVYLKLQLFKHSKWSLWEVGGVQGMRLRAANDDLFLARLPLPTKPHLQD